MIAEGITCPTFNRQSFQLSQTLLLVAPDIAGSEAFCPHEREVEDELQFIVTAAVISNVIIFADQQTVTSIFSEDCMQFFHQLMNTCLPPLILEHIMPIFFFELIFFRRLGKF